MLVDNELFKCAESVSEIFEFFFLASIQFVNCDFECLNELRNDRETTLLFAFNARLNVIDAFEDFLHTLDLVLIGELCGGRLVQEGIVHVRCDYQKYRLCLKEDTKKKRSAYVPIGLRDKEIYI